MPVEPIVADRAGPATTTQPPPVRGRSRASRTFRALRLRPTLVFPLVATLGFVVLVGLGWNQSSSGLLREQIEGDSDDPAGVFGAPNPLRFDEWMVTTSFVVSQDSLGYPQVNPDAMGGTDVSVASAIPSRDWATAFRPHAWGLLLLPFDQGFAVYWWLPVLLLALGTYALLLALRPGRPGFAAAGAATMVLAPFVQWWLLTGTLGCLGWAAVILACSIALGRSDDGPTRLKRIALLALIAYSTTAFLLLLYPPFQLACGWVVLAVLVGWTFRAGAPAAATRRDRLRPLVRTAAAGTAGVAVYVVFLLTRWDVVRAQLDTEYPGHRVVPSGGDTLARFFSGFLAARLPQAQALDAVPPALGGNASEASAFVAVGAFLALPALWLLHRSWRRERTVDGLLVALLTVLGLFASFLFVGGAVPDLLARATGLSTMQPARLYIGVGLLSLVLTAAVLRELDRQAVRLPTWVVAATGMGVVGACTLAALRIHDLSPQLAGDVADWLPLALVVAAVVVAAARGHGTAALAALAVFSLVATFRVHPLRDGVYDTRTTEVGQAVAAVDHERPGRWIALGTLQTEALLAQQPVDRRSGMSLYPVMDHWREVDPSGEHRAVYNRYALVTFTEDATAPRLATPDFDDVRIRFDPCGRYAQDHLRYVLADHQVQLPCLTLRRTVDTPAQRYLVYEIAPRSSE